MSNKELDEAMDLIKEALLIDMSKSLSSEKDFIFKRTNESYISR